MNDDFVGTNTKSKKEWHDLTKDEIVQLSCRFTQGQIADMFGISKSTVQKRCRNLKIGEARAIDKINERIGNGEFPEILQNITSIGYDKFAKAVTHFAFREGPVEDMHAAGKLSQEDMKILNKFVYNRLGYIFKLIEEKDYINLCRFYFAYRHGGSDWDALEIDDGGLEELPFKYFV